ncbi:MAG: polysaccharide biosynthesis tyrosine autokinase [Paludibacter sp.]|nr:polysaccharide biosynthesis tyrosine autokinase [Paludibacter sp.]
MNPNYETEEAEDEQSIDLLGLFFKYLSYWKWFVASVAVCLILAVGYLKTTTNVYEVNATVLLKDDKKGGGMAELGALKEMGMLNVKNNVDNELEILKTSSLWEQVVIESGLYAGYKKIGTFKDDYLYGSECPILVELPQAVLDTLSSARKFHVLVHATGAMEFSGVYQDKDYRINVNKADSQVTMPFGKIYIRKGEFHPSDDMTVEVSLVNPEKVAAGMLGSMTMDLTSKTTSVVNVTLTTTNIKQGKDFLNRLIEVYNREDMKDQNMVASNTAIFIDDRLVNLTRELGDVESRVENYKQDNGLTDIKSEAEMFIKQTGDFTQKRLEVETQLAIVSDIDEYIHKKENRYQLLPASTGIKSESVNQLIGDYNKLVLERKRLSRTASGTNQAMLDLTDQIESMFGTLQSSIRNEKRNWQIAQKDLLAKDSQNNARIKAIPRQEREYTEIKRQQGIKEALYLFLLQKKEENFLTMSVVVPKGKIIDRARSNGIPVSPKKSVILLMALMLGLIIPIVIITIGNLLRYHIENKEELEKISIVPVLGEIAKSEQTGNIIIKENSTNRFTEMFRLLRTNLLFVLGDPGQKVINVVSSISGEGKTFICINLAMSLALLDKKVLIIGLDVRKPKLGEYLGLENKSGITLYLSGNMDKKDLIRPSGIHPNLSVITAGPVPPNPSELMAKPLLDSLITECKDKFDYIILDTAPIGMVSDTYALNRFADVNLYVVRADYTPKKNIEDATNLFKHKKLNRMYFILNAADIQKASIRYGYGKKYGYGYGNKYGDGYGYDEK